LAPDTQFEFGPGHVFVLGKNGTGKTTLLDLMAKLTSCDLSSFLEEDEPVDIEWELERTQEQQRTDLLRLHLTVIPTQRHPVTPHPLFGTAEDRPEWRLAGSLLSTQIKVFRKPSDGPLVAVPWPSDLPGPEFRFHCSWDTSEVERPPVMDDLEKRQLYFDDARLEMLTWAVSRTMDYHDPGFGVGSPLLVGMGAFVSLPLVRFDEALETFLSIVGRPGGSLPIAEIEATRHGYQVRSVPFSLAPRFLETPQEGQDRVTDTDSDKNPDDLTARMVEILGADSIEIQPRLLKQTKTSSTWRGFDIYVSWPGQVKHHHDQLSFGQKRLLAFLWYAELFVDVPIFTDELTNGMHAGWVRQILDLLGDRQAFHAIQNPLLLDMTGPGDESEIPGNFIFCEAEVVDGDRAWRWRSPTAREASRLRKAWDAGFQQLSEILLSEGLW